MYTYQAYASKYQVSQMIKYNKNNFDILLK